MKVPVPSEGTGRGKKGGGRGGGGGRTPHRKAPAPQPPPPPSFQQAEWPDVASSPFQQAIPPAYGMTSGMAYPPAPAAGMPAPYPMACPPMPMYGMMPFMPYPHPMQYMPGMPNPVPAQPPEKSRGKQGTQGKASQRGGEGVNKKRRGKAKSKDGKGENPSDLEANPNCSEELLAVRSAQGNGVKAKLSFQEVLPHLLEFAQDQHGSRFLQGKLDEASPEERQQAFSVICADDANPDAVSLAKDVSGNFVVQKLFDIGTQEQKKKLAEKLQPEVASLSKDNYGCRVVQKAIGAVSKDLQVMLASSLQSNVTDCITNMHGNHVVQKCIEQMPPDSVSFIIHAVQSDTAALASHIYGCRVIQRLLEHCASGQLTEMLDRILSNIEVLSKNQFGNYVVQHMLEHGRIQDKERIIDVVEKCFEASTIGEHAKELEGKRAQLVDAVLGQPGDVNSPLCEMMTHRYGNYVVQRLMEHSRGTERERIYRTLNSLPIDFKSHQHGMHIMNALQKDFKEFNPDGYAQG
ncbi:unnamed protein product [Durusdinium trenchii]|uniref:PUM-HD domain-containing protein n=1 Tax=Durusdinium trenchii TaxID=1381693 RepID=A0ABP0JHC9_9DINO